MTSESELIALIPHHECGPYCRDGIHAFVCWCDLGYERREAVEEGARRRYAETLGCEVLAVDPAPEAETSAAFSARTGYRRMLPHELTPHAYLVLIRAAEGVAADDVGEGFLSDKRGGAEMPRRLPEDHVCGPWCHDGEHAVVFSVSSDDPARVVPRLLVFLARSGWQLLDATLAPEAPVNLDGVGEWVDPLGTSRIDDVPPAEAWAWLCRLRPIVKGRRR